MRSERTLLGLRGATTTTFSATTLIPNTKSCRRLLIPTLNLPIGVGRPCAAGSRRWMKSGTTFGCSPNASSDAGAQVIVFVRVTGTAKQSGAAPGTSSAHVQTLRDGRITRTDIFLDRAEALEAAGLRE